MSGFEVAGVILGSLPLIISALEHYAQGIATVKRFRRYKYEVESLIRQVETERVIFVNTLELLFAGLGNGAIMDSAFSRQAFWQGNSVDEKLRDRLSSAYDVYLSNVQAMDNELKMVMQKLALGPDGKASIIVTLTYATFDTIE